MITRLEHPVHGIKFAYSQGEINEDKRHGWKETDSDEVSRAVEAIEEQAEADLAKQYEAKFGRKPHHRMKRENIEKAIDDADGK